MTISNIAATAFGGVRGAVAFRRWRTPGTPSALVLLLHGLGEHSGQYASLAEALADAGVEVWAPDHAGHGLSEGERVLVRDIGDLVADAEALLRAARFARPGTPVVVVGHSLGATVATLLVGEIRYGSAVGDDPAAGVAGLVLTGSALLGSESTPGGLADVLASGIDPMDLRKDPGELVRDPEQAQRVRDDPLVWSGGLRPETLRALTAASARVRGLVNGGALDHPPVLLLHGEDDDLAPVEGARVAARTLPRARLVTYPHDRHNILHELDKDVVHAELLRFVLAITGPAAHPAR
jgi:acylglycerol lipase